MEKLLANCTDTKKNDRMIELDKRIRNTFEDVSLSPEEWGGWWCPGQRNLFAAAAAVYGRAATALSRSKLDSYEMYIDVDAKIEKDAEHSKVGRFLMMKYAFQDYHVSGVTETQKRKIALLKKHLPTEFKFDYQKRSAKISTKVVLFLIANVKGLQIQYLDYNGTTRDGDWTERKDK